MPLVHSFTGQSDAWSARQHRHLCAMAEYNYTLQHVPGKRNLVADVLSRNTLTAVQLGMYYNFFAEAQRQDPEYQACRTSCTSLRREKVPVDDFKTTLLCDVRVGTFPQPQRRFAHIHVDVVGHLPTSQGHCYLFTVIDRSNHWPEAIPMETATYASCTSALLSRRIAKYVIREHITSERGITFISQLWTSLANLLGIILHETTAYSPAANGMSSQSSEHYL
ncbi:uncharacterized protein [Palaemon carinicauda]|uniref:uncharacterized protein n=1 Tax=Palaemon carinicauda TaxID=392227 RepID=UPI0035B6906E